MARPACVTLNRADSETVALRQPVVPVADGLEGGFVRVDGDQLGEWHGHIATVPADQHQHVVGTGILGRQAADFDRFSFTERGDHLGRHAPYREGERDFVLQVVIPAQGLLFGPISVDDGFVVDSFFANAVFSRLGHSEFDAMMVNQFVGPPLSSV